MDKNDFSIENLSDLTIFSKYAKYNSDLKRRETWEEICDRAEQMHIKKYPDFKKDIIESFKLVREKKVMPSMRGMQFAGKPIELNNSRLYNCSFSSVQTYKDFAEACFLLLSGCGYAYSVQSHHTNMLPPIFKPTKVKKYLIGDSIEGWADSIRALFKAYMANGYLPLFDYSDIRPKGAELITAGGKAPGPAPLERCLNKIKSILEHKENGEKLKPIEIHDIMCHIADCVLSGGIRRAALLCLFDKFDEEMLNCKGNFKVEVLNGGFHLNPITKQYDGEVIYKNKTQYLSLSKQQFEDFQINKTIPWYYFEPQRARSNNSVVFLRNETTKEEYDKIWNIIKSSGSGEPGIFWTNNIDYGTNPCLTGDTLISTVDGNIRLDKLVNLFENNENVTNVFSFNIKENKIEEDIIINGALTRKKANIIKITLEDGKNIKSTPDHKVFTRNRDWIEVGKLTEKDILVKKIEKNKVEEIKISKIEIIENEDVYDITVKNNHNFFANDILVHNCAEVGFEFSRNFCNLTTINFSNIEDNEDFKERIKAATILGTLQAGYTDFHYLSSKWQKNSEYESLLGVSLTGICDNKNYKNYDWNILTNYMLEVNKEYSEKINIKSAARLGCIKPEGSSSCVLGTSSGIHARFAPYYIRRMRFNKNEHIAKYLINELPNLVEDEFGNPNGIVLSLPQKSPENSIYRTESALETLERVKFFYINWIKASHNRGDITHNVSCTVNIKNNEWEKVGKWIWENKDYYNALSVLPYDGGTYIQAPFEECNKEKYEEMMKFIKKIDLSNVIENEDETQLKEQVACGGNSCEII